MHARSGCADIPALHRLAILYLALPLIIWLPSWFEWWFGVPAAAAIAVGLWPALAGSWRPSLSWRVALLLAAGALAWTMLTAAGGLFDSVNVDWFKHRAIFADLGRLSWPVRLPVDGTTPLGDAGAAAEPLLRYYLAWYLPPGLAARWFGVAALVWAVPLWTWIGVTLLVLTFVRSVTSTTGCGRAVVAALILVFFSGMDIVRFFLLEGWDALGLHVSLAGWPKFHLIWHIEWDQHWGVVTQYSSNTTGLMWVPQHFIAAGLGTLLLLESRRRPRLLAAGGIVVAAIAFWSPFVAAGLMPLAAALLIRTGARPFLRWQNLVLAPLLAALVAVYLTSDTAGIPHWWLWQNYSGDLLARWLPLFYAVEFLALIVALLILDPRHLRHGFFVVGAATLLVLPLNMVGVANDLCMRASLPSLLVLCWYAARALLDGPRLPAQAHDVVPAPPARRLIPRIAIGRVLVVAILSIGAVTPLIEIARAVRYRDVVEAQAIIGDTAQRWTRDLAHQYGARDVPAVLEVLLKERSVPAAGRT